MALPAFNHLNPLAEGLRQSPFGLITDVDGTLSPTAPTPAQARVSPACRRHLARLCQQIALVAAVSGRTATQAKEMVNVRGMVYIGNHGLERLANDRVEIIEDARGYLEAVQAAISELSRLLTTEGITVENKGITATVHYRRSPDPRLAEKHVLEVIRNSPKANQLQVMPGRMAVNLLPPVAANKGTATRELITGYHLRRGIYLGDDVTDIDAFRAIHAAPPETDFKGWAIAVTSRETPPDLIREADFTLKGVREVARFLGWLSQTAAQLT
jgi:trehalose 6-phosphate phosphatase